MGEDYLLLYEYVDGMAERRTPHREAHLAHLRAAKQRGLVTLAGALGDRDPTGGAIAFQNADRAAIEAFVEADPYVRAGLVPHHKIQRWRLV